VYLPQLGGMFGESPGNSHKSFVFIDLSQMFAGQSVSVRCDVADGTCQILLSPQELLEKLAALVPPPRLNLVRYHGVLAPNATDRAQIVPGPQPVEETDIGDSAAETTPAQRRHRLAWAVLLARVFQFDVTVCDRCGGPVKIVAALTDPGSIRRYLEGVGLPARAPPIAPARPHAQQEFDMEYSGSAA